MADQMKHAAEDRAAGTPQRTAVRAPAASYLQYEGFEQNGRIRGYLFRRIAKGEAERQFVVNVDVALFAKYKVGIQEGPALCLRLLSAEPDFLSQADRPALQSLTDADMVECLDRRAAAQALRPKKRNGVAHAASADQGR